MKRISRFLTRRTMVNVVGVLVIASMLVGAAWPAGTVAHVTSRPHEGRITPVLQEGTPMTDAGREPTTVNGLELLLGEGRGAAAARHRRRSAGHPAARRRRDPADSRSHAGLAGRGRRRRGVQTAAAVAAATDRQHDRHAELPAAGQRPVSARSGKLGRWKCCALPPRARSRSRPLSTSRSTNRWWRWRRWRRWPQRRFRSRLEPALPGTWKWLGTKTLRFEYTGRPSIACRWRPSTWSPSPRERSRRRGAC